jgi:hypothetical protein
MAASVWRVATFEDAEKQVVSKLRTVVLARQLARFGLEGI